MAGSIDLPDVNVWLALTVPDHPHHARARRYWHEESSAEVAFCRMTALASLRLLTNRTVMGGEPLTVPAAWSLYRELRALPEVTLVREPEGCEKLLETWTLGESPSALLWTDAYLAAFASAGALRLVSFDRDLTRFEGLDLLRLEA